MYYPATPGCMAVSHGAAGSCAAGTCSGAVSAGACGAGQCGGGITGGESDDGSCDCEGHMANEVDRLRRWSDARWVWKWRLQWWWRRWRLWRRWRMLTRASLALVPGFVLFTRRLVINLSIYQSSNEILILLSELGERWYNISVD